MQKRLIACIVASLMADVMIANTYADEPRCGEHGYCLPLTQPGNTLMKSLVEVRSPRNLPPNNEVRAPDEIVVISDTPAAEPEQAAAQVVFDEKIVTETVPVKESASAINYDSGENFLSVNERAQLQALATRLTGKPNLRLSVIGHADAQPLSARKRAIYKDNQGLSEARAKEAAAFLHGLPGFADVAVTTQGKGDREPLVQCDKQQQAKSYQACLTPNRRVEIQVWYDQVNERTEQVARTMTPAPVEQPVKKVECAQAKGVNTDLPFRISVDGEPLATQDHPNTADVSRCVDVALEKSDIQMKYDPLSVEPALNAWVWPNAAVRGKTIEFHGYSNYAAWIRKAEIRIFAREDSVQGTPLAVLPYHWAQAATWLVPTDAPADLVFVLRVYDELERFDETAIKPLALVDTSRPVKDADKAERERLVGWGEDSRRLANIPVSGGAITVNGKHLRPDESTTVLGMMVPVDKNGTFAVRQILPAGPHDIDIEITDTTGGSKSYKRSINVADRDWFYIAVGDITLGQNNTHGPAALVTNDTQHYDGSTYLDGRGAFYLKGKIKGEYLLTASADTREQPLEDLFSNFSTKDPRYLVRRIDPDRYYPVYGDDSTTVDDAPTQGKFYVRVDRGDDHVLWGNFQTQWTGTELTQFSRGLYGADLLWKSDALTQYGEKQSTVNAFAAEPGTLGAREEFRGTGGSLYYLQHQDITQGSERVWVEIRDKDSGLVLERNELVPVQDYDLNLIQGRILLRAPLSSTADGSTTLIQTSSLNGNPVNLVVTYEYAPNVTALSDLAYGLRAETWLNDHLRIGATGYRQGQSSTQDQRLGGLDTTLRYKPGTWIKSEIARSDGTGAGDVLSLNGGFNFNNRASNGRNADAKRLEAQIDFAEVWEEQQGKGSFYYQDRDSGFSGPGQVTGGEAIRQAGGRITLPVSAASLLEIKADHRDATSQTSDALEANLRTQISPEWTVGIGVRGDNRDTATANASSILSQDGHRTDAIARLEYKPLKKEVEPSVEPVGAAETAKTEDWDAFGYVQGTVENSDTRDENNRAGAGINWRITDRLKATAEASEGNGGLGGKFGADYSFDDRSSGYLTYTLENERPDVSTRGRQGVLTTGSKYRVSDQMSLYGETRKTDGAGAESLINAFGLDLAPNDRWSYGAKVEIGTVSDITSGDLKRRGISLNTAYKFEKIKYSGALEYRNESGTNGDRQSWLVRNTGGYEVDPDWRLIGKLNFAISDGGSGNLPDADFTEVVAGAAWRPVKNDRWNALFKYTFFRDLPSPGQLSSNGTLADYAQKSHILSIDSIYDLKPWLSLGGKYGLRIGELKASKTDAEFFSSQAQLLVLRADLHWVKEWDAVCEVRTLKAREAQDQRSGFLLGVYRHLDKHFKLGGGYNFTDFSDDLTDLSYTSRGWFINLLGTY